tara:strand:- start:4369 stop:4818 length:450 start_codon:yes stop_codon:yes gene_type:complete
MKAPYLFFFITLIFLTSCTRSIEESSVSFASEGGKPLGNVFVEIADTLEERALGLMHRDALEENKGMFFIFEREDMHSFWMKNTYIPLDIIFISEDLRVVDIIQAELCKKSPCKNYTPKEKALYVLEVNQGYSKSKGIELENKVSINLL